MNLMENQQMNQKPNLQVNRNQKPPEHSDPHFEYLQNPLM